MFNSILTSFNFGRSFGLGYLALDFFYFCTLGVTDEELLQLPPQVPYIISVENPRGN